jgi:tetratricopeptide (TPR) repeat protein
MAVIDDGKKTGDKISSRSLAVVSLTVLKKYDDLTTADIEENFAVIERFLSESKNLSEKFIMIAAEVYEKYGRKENAAHFYILAGELHEAKGESVKAILHYRKALTADPGNWDIHEKISQIFMSLGLVTESENERKILCELVNGKKLIPSGSRQEQQQIAASIIDEAISELDKKPLAAESSKFLEATAMKIATALVRFKVGGSKKRPRKRA